MIAIVRREPGIAESEIEFERNLVSPGVQILGVLRVPHSVPFANVVSTLDSSHVLALAWCSLTSEMFFDCLLPSHEYVEVQRILAVIPLINEPSNRTTCHQLCQMCPLIACPV